MQFYFYILQLLRTETVLLLEMGEYLPEALANMNKREKHTVPGKKRASEDFLTNIDEVIIS